MTPPARKAPVPRSSPASGASSTARWLNVVTTLVLGAAVVIVAFAAAPSLLHAGLSPSEQDQDFPPPVRAHAPTLVPRDHPRSRTFLEEDDDDADPPPRFSSPRSTGRGAPPQLPPDVDSEPGLGLGLKSGVVMRPLQLRDRRTGSVLHDVRAGSTISVLHEDGDWVLVVHQDGKDLVTGWVRRSELSLR